MSIRLLVLADEKAGLGERLARRLGNADIDIVWTVAHAKDAVKRTLYDVIVVDLALPEAARGVGALHGYAAEIPIVVVSNGEVDQVALALQTGATDRIQPEELDSPVAARIITQARDRQRTAVRARDADHRFAAFVDAIPMGVTIVDSSQHAYYANDEARRILEDDLTLSGLVGAEASFFDAVLAGRMVRHRDIEFRRDHRRLQLDVAGFPVPAPDGSVEYAVAVVQDITERKRLEHAVRTMAKLDAMGAMAASVAHDFNNLLSVIGTFAYLALETLEPEASAHDDVMEIIKATERSQHMVGKLLSFAHEGGPREANSDLNSLIVSSKKMLTRLLGDGVELALDLDGALPRAAIGESDFEEILINLVVNARDAMPRGGTLSITSRTTVGTITVCVADTGIGMDAETRRLLFEPLFTTKAPGKGTGLGMASVRSLVTEAGGDIQVESELGAGTRFTLTFRPVASSEPAEQAAKSADEAGEADGPARTTILVVDDEDPFRRMLVRQLGRLGYDVAEAENAREALAYVERDARLDLLLSDVDMPGLDGPTLAQKIRERRPDTPIVFMTGFDPPQVVERVLLKPFPVEELADAVSGALDGR